MKILMPPMKTPRQVMKTPRPLMKTHTQIMKALISFSGVAAVAGLVSGCATTPNLVPTPQFAPVFPVAAVQPRAATGSLFVDGRGESLFGRQKDYHVGDIITVLLNEATQATRVQNTTTERKATNDAFPSIQAGLASALGKNGLPLGAGLSSAIGQIKADGATTASAGTGNHGQTATLIGSISVSVVDVMSNGNLVVRGEKQLALSEGTEVIQVSGIVRTGDIAPNGTVQSRRLANAQFSYRGSGDLASATQQGWGTRALYRLWPF